MTGTRERNIYPFLYDILYKFGCILYSSLYKSAEKLQQIFEIHKFFFYFGQKSSKMIQKERERKIPATRVTGMMRERGINTSTQTPTTV